MRLHIIDGHIYYDPVPIFSNSLRQHNSLRHHVIHFSGPLYDIQNNQTIGILALTFPLNRINDIIREAAGTVSGEVDIDLVSNDGLLIYSNNKMKVIGLIIMQGFALSLHLKYITDL